MSIATTSDFEAAPARPLATPLILATGCVALADWLFYGWNIGISFALFLGALGVVALFSNGMRASGRSRFTLVAVFIAGLLPLIEDVNFLSVTVATVTTAMAIIAIASPQTSWPRQLLETATVPFRGPFLLAKDTIGALRHMKIWTPGWLGWLVAWIVPLCVFAIFLTLFSSANPLIEHSLMQIDLRKFFELISPWRLSFWIFIACMIWPLIYRRIKSTPRRIPQLPSVSTSVTSDLDYLLGAQAITRSLVLSNALFALQTVLDLSYLWGGAALPDGITYASYAHRGAYPLIFTALLAAAFVLVAMRADGPAKKSRLIRPLVLAWITQNVLLVISSIFRLDLYVATYSLTYLRLAAFIWMGLVAAGLLSILAQIVWRKSTYWLTSTNAATVAFVLYGCCFINAPRLVAFYNVEHCREVSGTGQNLDWRYLRYLGPQALPAIERRRKKLIASWEPDLQSFMNTRETFVSSKNWRSFGFRAWRLQHYFANNPVSTPFWQG
ncbi:DUF4173 domain-containing protein [Bradyrhizobium sp.]|uniref:DUF4153 domain-containing protein n=1 Tax=Bradyrhizobium sp. TaxID=376 RepID=UPI0026212A2B|nr:DUF4173 domain-containing protein [Bradyrhizobium sp.]